ncbi:MAG: hypothetical protein KKF44_04110 [Nanoarchaeota archaeon]|nr:hypothetical protein [Nanoarchaeota archaeon]
MTKPRNPQSRQPIRSKKPGLKEKIKKHLNLRTLLITIVGIILLLMYSKYITAVVLMVAFLPLAWYTVQFTRFIDGITIETHTASCILLGFMFGSQFGMISGFVLSSVAYLGNGIAKIRGYLDIIYTGLGAGYVAGYMAANTTFSFEVVFVLVTLIKNFVSFILNHLFFDPDKLSNFTYRITSTFLNTLVYRVFFVLIYNIVSLLQ